MNKKMIFAAIAAIAVSSGIAYIYTQKQESNLNALTLANVEALSSGEVSVKDCPEGKDICDAVQSGSTLYIFTYDE